MAEEVCEEVVAGQEVLHLGQILSERTPLKKVSKELKIKIECAGQPYSFGHAAVLVRKIITKVNNLFLSVAR